MAFRRVQGKTKFMSFPVTVSTALSNNSLVELTSGQIAAADDDETQIVGVLRHAIASTDADYATAREVEVEVPVEKHVVWEADATDATFVLTDIGTEFGISSSLLVDRTDTTNDVFFMTGFVSSSVIRGWLKFNQGLY